MCSKMESFSELARLPGKKPNILTVDIDVPLGGAGGRRVVPQRPRFVFRFSANPFPRRPASGPFFLVLAQNCVSMSAKK